MRTVPNMAFLFANRAGVLAAQAALCNIGMYIVGRNECAAVEVGAICAIVGRKLNTGQIESAHFCKWHVVSNTLSGICC